jgi:hypothetical protein
MFPRASQSLRFIKRPFVVFRTMRLMVIVFFVVMLIVLDQTRFHGHYLEQFARLVAWLIN